MDAEILQAWWFDRQGLMNPDPTLTAAEVLARTGWARSVGGANPYLTLFARAGIGRQQVDADVASREIHELPTARGCTYVVPRADFALGLLAGHGFGDEGEMAAARKFLGVTDEEIECLSEGVVAALEDEPLDPRDLRERLGDRVRSLGPEGKKRGITTTLPLALGRLQSRGRIRRVPINGRLDQQRYRYALWAESPLSGYEMPREEVMTELARRYFRWIGPASAADFQWFSALGVKAAKEAIAPLGLVPLEAGSELIMFPDDRERLRSFRPPAEPRYALVGSIDGISLLRRDLGAMLAPEDRGWQFTDERGMKPVGGLQDLPAHAILDRGRLIGLWEFDPEAGEIVHDLWVPRTADLDAAIARTEAFVRDRLGDARAFSLDSPESRRPRLAAMRGIAAG